MYCYLYKNPNGELFMSTLRDTGVDAMRAYLCLPTATEARVVYDLFEAAKLRGGKIVEVEIRETGR